MPAHLVPLRHGLVLALLTLALGFGLGAAFGAAEESLKADLAARAAAVLDSVYHGDQAKVDSVLSKSWVYYQRAHLHAGAMGTAALAMMLLLAQLDAPRRLKTATSIALGLGGLGYSSYWLLAGRAAPALGSTGAAKASLEWLAVPTSGMFIVGLFVLIGVAVCRSCGSCAAGCAKSSD